MNNVKLSDVCNLIDSLHITPKYIEKGFPMVRAADISNKFLDLTNCVQVSKSTLDKHNKKYVPKKGDILITRVGVNLGNVSYNDTKEIFCLGQNISIISSSDNGKFLYYYLLSPKMQSFIKKLISGSAYKCIGFEKLKELPCNFNNINCTKIGNLLYSIDKKINLNNKINDKLESMAKTIYDYWFLQFEFPNEEGKPYKSSGGKMVWNDELKREIPEGWINGHLKEYIKNQKAGDWGKENAINNYQKEVTCIRGADFSSITSFEKMDMPRRFILEKNSFKLLSVYDLLIEISGGSPIQSTGRICYINDAVLKRFSTKLITSNFCKAISLTDNNYFYWFYMLWKTLYINNVFFNYESKTTGIKNLLFDIMCEKYPICKPPIQIIRLYNQQVTPYFNKIQQNIIENQELTSLRDFLLPLLMNGQVGFKEDKAEG